MKHIAKVVVFTLAMPLPGVAQIVERNGVILPNVPGAAEVNREAELQSYLFLGQVGIDKTGMLTVRSSAGVPARVQADIERQIGDENDRRRSQIEDTLRERGSTEDKRKEIAKELADEWRAAAQANWWVQRDNGEWQQGPPR